MRFESVLLLIVALLMLAQECALWRRRRRRRSPPPCSARDCVVSQWGSWSGCTHRCGNSGTQTRRRTQTSPAACGGRCPYVFDETRACNRNSCQNGGTPRSGHCACRPGYRGTCCELGKFVLQNCRMHRTCFDPVKSETGCFHKFIRCHSIRLFSGLVWNGAETGT